MSKSTRSKGKSLRLNTLVSSSKQGNNSMASVQDSEDSNGEAEGSDIITGYGPRVLDTRHAVVT